MNRRGFLSSLAAAAGIVALDPERALWLPGKKLISIPKTVHVPEWQHKTVISFFPENEIAAIYRKHDQWAEPANAEIFQRFIRPQMVALEAEVAAAEKKYGRKAYLATIEMPLVPLSFRAYFSGERRCTAYRVISDYEGVFDMRFIRTDVRFKV